MVAGTATYDGECTIATELNFSRIEKSWFYDFGISSARGTGSAFGDWLASSYGEPDPPGIAHYIGGTRPSDALLKPGGTRLPGALPKQMRLCRPPFSEFFKQSALRWRNAVRAIPLPLRKGEATLLPPTKVARPGAHFYFASGAGSMSASSCEVNRSSGIVLMISRASSFRSLARRVAA